MNTPRQTLRNDRGTEASTVTHRDRYLVTVSVIDTGYGTRRTQAQRTFDTATEAREYAASALRIF